MAPVRHRHHSAGFEALRKPPSSLRTLAQHRRVGKVSGSADGPSVVSTEAVGVSNSAYRVSRFYSRAGPRPMRRRVLCIAAYGPRAAQALCHTRLAIRRKFSPRMARTSHSL